MTEFSFKGCETIFLQGSLGVDYLLTDLKGQEQRVRNNVIHREARDDLGITHTGHWVKHKTYNMILG